MGLAAAVVGAAAITAGASIYGSSQQAHAAKRAANLSAPFTQAGQQALPGLESLLGINGDPASMLNFLKYTPGYQFTLGQGLESVQNGFAPRGLASSGAALKGAANYATGLAQNTYQNVVGNYQNLANMGANAAVNQGNNLVQAGNAQAAGLMGAANAVGSAPLNYLLLNNAIGGGNLGGGLGTPLSAFGA